MRWKYLFIILAALMVLSVAWYLGSPLFISKTVHEEFPPTFPDHATVGKMSPDEKKRAEIQTMEKLAGIPMKSVQEMPPTFGDPRLIKQGNFRDVDSIHRGKGEAKIYRFPQANLLRLENIEIANGPDLYVYLAKHPNPGSAQDVKAGFINLGKLKGNLGNQNYGIPSDADLSKFHSVVIFCKLFGVLFSPAPLQSP